MPPRTDRSRRFHLLLPRLYDDRGFALPAAMLGVLAVSAIVGVLFATAMAEQRATRVSQDFENAIHAAEAAIDHTIGIINEDNDYTDGIATPPSMTPAQERQWAIDTANASDPADRVTAANGWSYGFRPLDPAGDPADFMYGVGTVTEGPYTEPVRVIKIEFDAGYYRPRNAVLSDGNLKIEESTIVGAGGRTHTNANQELKATPTVEQGSTYTGTSTGNYKTITGTPQTPTQAQPQSVPEISAISFYESRLRQQTASDEGTSGTWFADGPTPSASGKDPLTYDGDWFDMCIQVGQPQATVRVPADDGAAPCTGSIYRVLNRTGCGGAVELEPSHPNYATQNSLFRGWHAHSDYWHICHEFPEDAGIFFLNGGAGQQTKVGVDDVTHSSRITIISDHGLKMDKEMQLEAWLDGYLMQAEGNLEISGEHHLTGGIGSRQCVTMEGSGAGTTLVGAVITNNESGCTTEISKGVTIDYDGGLALPLGGIVRIAAWTELSASS